MIALIRPTNLAVIFLFLTGYSSTLAAKERPALCDLSPVAFNGTELYKAIQLIGGDPHPIDPNFVPKGAVFSFSQPHKVGGFKNPAVDLATHMEFDAEGVFEEYYKEVSTKVPDVGCSSRTAHSINWTISPDGGWQGHFHVKYVNRACFHVPYDGDAQIDKATYEIDFYNQVNAVIADDRKHITPKPSNWSSSNVPDLVKAIAPALGALVQIVTVGFVPQADVQAIDGWQGQEAALKMMADYELTHLHPVSIGTKEDQSYSLDFLFSKVFFRNDENRPIFSIDAVQNPVNLQSESSACTIRDVLEEMKVQSEHLDLNGTEYTVKTNDSLWNISNTMYGNGRYHLLVAAANGIPLPKADQLRVGQKLVIQPLAYFHKNPDILLVEHGNSLWQIASQKKQISYKELDHINQGDLTNPDLIFPVQVLKLKDMSPRGPRVSRHKN